jgi:hypothetical protein
MVRSRPPTARPRKAQGPGLSRAFLNKATAGDTASLLFQTGFGGRAEMGTAGGDDFTVKVSANGSAWFTALEADAASGEVTLPAPLHLGGQPADPASPTICSEPTFEASMEAPITHQPRLRFAKK